MGRCLTVEQLSALASGSLAEREASRLMRHCRRCAVCRDLLEDWRNDESFAQDVRWAIGAGAGSSVTATGERGPVRQLVPLIAPDSIAGYEILGEIHRGAQGVVYRATRKSTGREVAIKVAFEPVQVAGRRPHRLDREIELASRLRHPNIIAIFDSGATPDGRCYFVMDYVHGLPVDQYVRERELGLDQALQLFVTICEAINHAHQRGVIHRDLKPSNIVVDAEGVPRVLDFGLAKAVRAVGERFSSVVSSAGQLLGTVPYMAPEQLAGQPQAADIRSDVYALGVLLYEILAGRLPFDIELAAPALLQAITEGSPMPPSQRWTPITGIDGQDASGSRHAGCPLDDELDAIVLKAMAPAPDHRYQNANDLARDVQHYLAGEPVEAKRKGRLYVVGKLLRRYRLPVSIAAGFVLLLAIAVAVTTTLYVKVKEQRELVKAERDHAVLAERDADTRADELRELMYFGRISSAAAAIDAGNFQRAREELYVCPSDLRHWEWYWLASQFNQPEQTLVGHEEPVSFLIGEGGNVLTSGGKDGVIRFWDLEHMQAIGSPLRLAQRRDACFAPGGQRYAIWELDGKIKVYSIDKDEPVSLKHQGDVRQMCFSDDSALLAIVGTDGFVAVFDVVSGKLLHRLEFKSDSVLAASFSPDRRFFAVANGEGSVCVWSLEAGSLMHVFRDSHQCVIKLVWKPDGTKLISGCWAGSIMVWDLTTGKLDRTLETKGDGISALAVASDGNSLVSADLGGIVCFWDLNTSRLFSRVSVAGCNLKNLALVGGGRWLAGTVDGGKNIHVWDVTLPLGRVGTKAHDHAVHAVAFSPDGRLISAGDDAVVKLWEVFPTLRLVRTFAGHEDKIRALACSADGTWFATGSMDRTIRIWDLKSGSPRDVLRGHEDSVLSVAISPDGQRIASGGSDVLAKGKDNSVRIWDASSGQELMCLRGHQAGVKTVAFSPDGARVASGSRDHTAMVWDLKSGKPIATFKGHTAPVRRVIFSLDGTRVFSAAEDDTVQSWDPLTGKLDGVPLAQPKSLCDLALSPDGSRMATCGYWDHVSLWPGGNVNWEFLALRGQDRRAWTLAFSPDGTCLAIGDNGGGIWVWRAISPQDLARNPQAARDLAAGAKRLWSLRQHKDAQLLFEEAIGMHRPIFGADNPQTQSLLLEFEGLKRGDFSGSIPPVSAESAAESRPAVSPGQ